MSLAYLSYQYILSINWLVGYPPSLLFISLNAYMQESIPVISFNTIPSQQRPNNPSFRELYEGLK